MKITIEGRDVMELLEAVRFDSCCSKTGTQQDQTRLKDRERMAFRLPSYVAEGLRNYAKDHHVTATHVVTLALEKYLDLDLDSTFAVYEG